VKWALAAITLLALALRLVGIGEESLWIDEGWSEHVTRQAPAEMLSSLVRDDVHPPLYHLLLWGWRRLFPSIEGMRALSAVLMAASVPWVFLFGDRLGGRTVGLTAAILAAVSPTLVFFGQEMRSYALVVLLASISCALWVRLPDAPRRVWIGTVIATTLLLWTHYLTVLLIAAQAVTMARSKRWWTAMGAAAVLFLPWAPIAWGHVTRVSGNFWLQPPDGETVRVAFQGFCYYTDDWTFEDWRVRQAQMILWAIVLALGAIAAHRKLSIVGSLVVVPPLLEILVSVHRPIFYARTMLYVTIGLCVLAGFAAAALRSRAAATALVASLVVVSGIGLLYQRAWIEKEDWRGAAQVIERNRRPGDGLITSPSGPPDGGEYPLAPYLSSALPSEGERLWVVLRFDRWDPDDAAVERRLREGPWRRRSVFRFLHVTVALYEPIEIGRLHSARENAVRGRGHVDQLELVGAAARGQLGEEPVARRVIDAGPDEPTHAVGPKRLERPGPIRGRQNPGADVAVLGRAAEDHDRRLVRVDRAGGAAQERADLARVVGVP
jgi:hypothetical protein